ncbi:hypothetical protein Hbl1158_12755 [Halobaculum sp. CBA1158]|uniref:hypothetical protein n=1 Tax=Halobaculum sp. CBA1158 TaxID=2904243 RepID=UPI001F3B37DA|nr:hypothetical protein [Halobaculum sp. CBA1158]UIO99388.1 hypothetical protein Hbl1158_12755 [Halobaculum sp. CBA1158]
MAVGPASLYQLFFLSASAAVVLLGLSTYVLGRLIGHDRALGAMLALVAVFTGVGAGFGLPPDAARIPVALGFAFLYVPVGVGGLVAKGVSVAPWREVCRLLIGGWMAALVVALVTQAAGASLPALIGWTPGLFGLEWYVGFLAYMALLGVVAGAVTLALLARDGRGEATVVAGG